MAIAKYKNIYSVSSEHEMHPASNLLKTQHGKTWKTKNRGEKQATVVLELEKSGQITGIDIGNEHSAFFEVFVGKAGCVENGFKEILITLSLMTPTESKTSTNCHRVRCFAEGSLIQDVSKEKWNLVKVVCTQPFNKYVEYGLSFIKVHVKDPEELDKSLILKNIQLSSSSKNLKNAASNFTLREESSDSESESSISLFNRWKLARDTTNKKACVPAIRKVSRTNTSATTHYHEKKMLSETADKTENYLNRNKDELLFGPEDDELNEILQSKLDADVEHLKKEKEKKKIQEKTVMPKDTISKDTEITKPSNNCSSNDEKSKTTNPNNIDEIKISSSASSSVSALLSTASRKRSPPSPGKLSFQPRSSKNLIDKKIKYESFNRLLKGVVLVISGIQNPDRADLRRNALAMGAKYKTEWDNNCTHLICAFKNTPKYNQVCGHGKIVTKNWIDQCYRLKKRLPWRRYSLDKNESNKPESEDEILDISIRPEPQPQPQPPSKRVKTEIDQPKNKILSLAHYDLDYSDDNKKNIILSSGSDTEDEIIKVQSFQSNKKKIKDEQNNGKSKKMNEVRDVYEVSTDEEEYVKHLKTVEEPLHDFYRNVKFFINSEISAVDKILLKQYIKEFNGELTDSFKDADYAVSEKLIQTPKGFNGQIVKPLWIVESNNIQKMLPLRRYLLSDTK